MVPVPSLPPYPADATHAPVVLVLLGVLLVGALVFVLLALGARRWLGTNRVAGWLFVGALVLMVGGFVAAFVADRLTFPDRQHAVGRARAERQDAVDRTLAALGAAYGVTVQPGQDVPTSGRLSTLVTFPDGAEVVCYVEAREELTLTCPRELPRDPAAGT